MIWLCNRLSDGTCFQLRNRSLKNTCKVRVLVPHSIVYLLFINNTEEKQKAALAQQHTQDTQDGGLTGKKKDKQVSSLQRLVFDQILKLAANSPEPQAAGPCLFDFVLLCACLSACPST